MLNALTPPTPASTPTRVERRLAPRLAVMGQIHGHTTALDVPIVVRDISRTGFAVEGPVPFPVGAVHDFRFTTSDGRTIMLLGEVVHRLRMAAPGAEVRYLVGLRFLRIESATVQGGIALLLSSLDEQPVAAARH